MSKVLIVDDSREIGSLLSHFLKGEYETEYCECVSSAMAYLQRGNFPDLIITDIRMPKVSGYDFLTMLKASEIYREIPVFVLSAIEGSNDQIKLLEMGAADFVQKPFNPEILKAKIKKWIKTA